MGFSPAQLWQALQHLPPVSRYRVAYSGGADSHVLLHALASLRGQVSSTTPQPDLSAVHIHHGLQPGADTWAAHCEAACRALGVPCVVRRVEVRAGAGESPEAAARRARYAALAELVGEDEAVLSAHHLDDQAETLLLQLLRGAGVQGLAAMPLQACLGAGRLYRPLLAIPRADLRAYAVAHGLTWVEDPSNRNEQLDRNYLRHQIMPLLQARWPACTRNLARAATHQGEAAALLENLADADWQAGAQADYASAGHTAGFAPWLSTLPLAMLAPLRPARQRNLLRTWLRRCGLGMPSTAVLTRIQHEVIPARMDAEPCVTWAGGEVRRYRDSLHALPLKPSEAEPAPQLLDLAELFHSQADGVTRAAFTLQRPATQSLCVEAVSGAGLSQARLAGRRVELRYRRGGESCRPQGRGHRHALKKLFQEWGVPPWQRGQIPLVYVDGELAQVVGHSLCEPYAAASDEPGWLFTLTGPDAGVACAAGTDLLAE